MGSPATYILLTLGEELLLGLTPNGHLTYIGEQLRRRGATLHANATISDAPGDIAAYFDLLWQRADILITTGGLGPTVDDRTKEIIAERLGERLVFDADTMTAIEERFRQLGIPLSENNRKQAYRFESAEILPNANGTAPGLWLEKDGKILAMLPGPPHELQPLFEKEVLPRLAAHRLLHESEAYLQIRTTGIGESSLESFLQPLLIDEDGLELAFCAHPGVVDVRLSLPGDPANRVRLEALAQRCRDALGDRFLAFGEHSLVQLVSNRLRQNRLTLSTAESCTGGLISSELTNQPGASDVFLGGVVSYSVASKGDLLGVSDALIQSETPVSEPVAIAMAEGAAKRFGSDFAISVTGYLGPTGGTESNPIGTIYVGLRTPDASFARRFSFRGPRTALKQRTVNAAMDLLFRALPSDA